MKFNEVPKDQWNELKPYLDTCLLPVTGMSGSESPIEATKALEDLRDALDLFEIPYRGRTVTYPALHYVPSDVEGICRRLREEAGFAYVVIVTAHPALNLDKWQQSADQVWRISVHDRERLSEVKQEVDESIQRLWQSAGRSSS